ncbi:MAG: DUF1028 domain-containing protein [Candidatus Aminicenantes bacterium]|nr:DUF1028 domain-containing protein [Candidatus Aminicenantes bacterium]MDH5383665.1 DUF1028 domain-containing protein [Candidatus Aminicenantes bacterium]
MRRFFVFLLCALLFTTLSLKDFRHTPGCASLDFADEKIRPVSTYSIVAYDRETGQLGVAVQSHWFSVGPIVPWAESGIGAIATQSFVEVSYGPLGLELMRTGKSPEEALRALVSADKNQDVRQVAMVDAQGRVAAHTGKNCISEAGHYIGDGFTCQANMMLKNTVWDAMANAFQNTKGELADKLVAALEAAEDEGGDIRGKQSAALIVVKGKSSGVWWRDRLYDLRIEDHPTPVPELKRLLKLNKAYNHMNQGDEFLTENKIEEAMKAYTKAMEMYPDNAEMVFWPAVTLAATGSIDKSLPLFKKVFAMDENWAILLPRLTKVGQLPDDKALIQKILSVAPQKKD